MANFSFIIQTCKYHHTNIAYDRNFTNFIIYIMIIIMISVLYFLQYNISTWGLNSPPPPLKANKRNVLMFMFVVIHKQIATYIEILNTLAILDVYHSFPTWNSFHDIINLYLLNTCNTASLLCHETPP